MPTNYNDICKYIFFTDNNKAPYISYDDCVDELDEAENRIYNLSLYLDYVRVHYPRVWRELNTQYDGLPGWSKHMCIGVNEPKNAFFDDSYFIDYKAKNKKINKNRGVKNYSLTCECNVVNPSEVPFLYS